MQTVFTQDDTYYEGPDGEMYCVHGNLVDDCPVCKAAVDESHDLVREFVRESLLWEERSVVSSLGQLALDLCGLIPGIGEVCDLTNTAIYLSRKDYLYAALSAVSLIPEIGDLVGKGGKLTAWVVKTFPKGSAVAAKYGPDVAKQILDTRRMLVKNAVLINEIFDKLEESEKFKQHVPLMRNALNAFVRRPGAIDVAETSTVGGGSIAGYTLPFGMGGTGTTGVPDSRSKKKRRRRQRKK